MSDLDPSGPSQPTLDDSYKTAGNQVTKEPAERAQANQNATSKPSGNAQDHRVPQEQSSSQADATPTSLAQGVRGAPAGEEAKGKTEEDVGRHQELDGEQMYMPGEGRVADAVEEKPGATGGEQGMEMDLDRKKEEQSGAREAIKEKREHNVDVAGVLGQRSAPADPTEKDGYPNSGD